MSRVTNAILTWRHEDDETLIPLVNAFFAGNLNGTLGFVSCDDDARVPSGWYGGSKMLECTILIGAFNYLDLEGFTAHLRSVPFEEPQHVRLFICEQDDDAFRMAYA